MKRGMTAVVTIILLLLMAVAAVGGAYLWFGRFQTETQAGVSTQMEEGVSSQTGGLTILSAYGSETSASDAGGNPLNGQLDDDYNYWCSSSWLSANESTIDRGATTCDGTTAEAKVSLVVKNTGTTDVSASTVPAQNEVAGMTVLVDGKSVSFHVDNGTGASYNGTFIPASWDQGETRRVDIDYTCAEIAAKTDKRVKIDVIPKQGATSSDELSCEDCCASLGASQSDCDSYC